MYYALAKPNNAWGDKLNLFIALAPVTRVDHTMSDLFKFFSGSTKIV